MKRYSVLAVTIAAAISVSPFSYAADLTIIPSGQPGSSPTVRVDTSGHTTIDIVPVFDGVTGDISHNTYQQFHVPKAGVSLDNQTVDARTIINEVTSTHPSYLYGSLSVLGNQAHVIIANPNGITVDGGRFINTGGLALTTGVISFSDEDVTPITTQRNTVLTTNKGQINITGDGLSGVFTHLALIAKKIRINAPITNEHVLADADVQLFAGSSTREIDSSVSAIDLSNSWIADNTNTSLDESDATLIDITGLGSITSGRVEIAVTDQGAGVRHAGDILASQNEFTIATNGQITVSGGTITAQSHIAIEAERVDITAVETAEDSWQQASIISNEGGVTIQSTTGNINNAGGLIQGATRNTSNTSSLGGITLNAKGKIVNRTVAPGIRGIFYSTNDDLVVTSEDEILNRSGRFISLADITFNAVNGVDNSVEFTSPDNYGVEEQFSITAGRRFFRKRTIKGSKVTFTTLTIPGESSYIDAEGDVSINAASIDNKGGSIYAQNGQITLTTSSRIENEAIRSGEVWIERECVWLCSSRGGSSMDIHGGNIQASGDIILSAPDAITNTGGNILSVNGDITLPDTTTRVTARSVQTYQFISMDRGMSRFFNGDYNRLYGYDQGGSFIANMGRLSIQSPNPVLVDGGQLLSAETEDIPSGTNIVREPSEQPIMLSGGSIGLLGKVLD